MPYSYAVTTASGSTPNVAVPFSYISKADVHVSLNGVMVADNTLVWLTDSSIQLPSTPVASTVVKVYRLTNVTSQLVSFTAPAIDDPNDLNLAFTQLLYVCQEAFDANALTSDELTTIIDYVNSAMAAAADSATAASVSQAAAAASAAAAALGNVVAASQAEAEAGVNNVHAMTPLRTYQALLALELLSSLTAGGLIAKTTGATARDYIFTVPKSTQAQAIARTDDTTAMTPLRVVDAMAVADAEQLVGACHGSATNWQVTNDATNPNTDFNVAPGSIVQNGSSTADHLNNATMIKRIDTTWAAGGATRTGALDVAPSVGNSKTVHVFSIGKLNVAVSERGRASNVATLKITGHGFGAGGTVRVRGLGNGYDGWATIASVPDADHITYANTGANEGTVTGLAGLANGFDILASQSFASAVMPTGYTVKKYLWSLQTDGSGNLYAYTPYGDECIWTSPSLDQSAVAAGTNTVAVRAPLDINTKVQFNLTASGGTPALVHVNALSSTSSAPSVTVAPLATAAMPGSNQLGVSGFVWTDTAASVRVRSIGTTTYLATLGYRNPMRRAF